MGVFMTVKLFADSADPTDIIALAENKYIQGFTTNPTLMRKAAILDYEAFAKSVLAATDKPISFEVFADEPDEMVRQGMRIASWGKNAVVKIPVMNTKGQFMGDVVGTLAKGGVCVNVTAILWTDHIATVAERFGGNPGYLSYFAGRVADTGRDPIPDIESILRYLKQYPLLQLIWASPREVFNYYQAENTGCHIITMTPDLIKKLSLRQRDLWVYSLDTVKMFYADGQASGYKL
jgi:transaldolase